jgi:hypothetical protein
MEYITGINPDNYNPTYFNILESIEYEMLVYEHMTVFENYFDVVEEDTAGTSYTKPKGLGQRLWGAIRRKNPDGKETKGSAFMDKIKTYFKIVREKIKEILTKFMQKVDELFGLNQKFIKERLYLLRGVDGDFWDGATVTIYPYNVNLDATIYTTFQCPEIDSKSNQLKTWMGEGGTKEEFIIKHFKKVMDCAGEKDGFKEAAKNFFRGTKNSQDKMFQYTKNDANIQASKAYVYLASYKDKTARIIRDQMTKLSGGMERVERDFENNKMMDYVNESWYTVYEEIQKVDPGKAGVSNGTTQIEGENGKEGVEPGSENKVGTHIFTRMRDYGNILMTLQTAQMTIAEEYYFAAISVLKHLYSAADKQGYLNKEKAREKQNEHDKMVADQKEAARNGRSGKKVLDTATSKAV